MTTATPNKRAVTKKAAGRIFIVAWTEITKLGDSQVIPSMSGPDQLVDVLGDFLGIKRLVFVLVGALEDVLGMIFPSGDGGEFLQVQDAIAIPIRLPKPFVGRLAGIFPPTDPGKQLGKFLRADKSILVFVRLQEGIRPVFWGMIDPSAHFDVIQSAIPISIGLGKNLSNG